MATHWILLRIHDRLLWAGDDRWVHDPTEARWFDTKDEAVSVGIKELDGQGAWSPIEIPTGKAAA